MGLARISPHVNSQCDYSNSTASVLQHVAVDRVAGIRAGPGILSQNRFTDIAYIGVGI